MAFIISKKSIRRGEIRERYYLVENYREGKRVRRRSILSLWGCKTLNEAFELAERREAWEIDMIRQYERKLEDYHQTGKNPFPILFPNSDKDIEGRLRRLIDMTKKQLERDKIKKEIIKKYM